ncbi:hypothetical protein SAY86_026885 [Trapa natans]|uniref:Uncharacterized protein n=1 Tax=Trapa natans TaxID=22666 RepID=A0AAN7KLE5_TRANT|nr:hypothetical protein SAY86_026885 [Trapa natans]
MDSRQLCMSFFIFFFLVLAKEGRAQGADRIFDIRKFGAIGDGKSDSSKAIQDAFASACNAAGGRSRIVVPLGTFVVKSAVFNGPCKGWIEFSVGGIIKALAGPVNDDGWVVFRHIDGLAITGNGKFDGLGQSAWNFNNCKKNPNCRDLPTSIQLEFIENSVVSGISSLNSKYFHIKILQSNSITIDGVGITAPENSPNADGIHISNSQNIRILNSIISTGDDCVSMGAGSTNILVYNVTCGPGHGISIGSLGKYDNEADVNGITVDKCTLSGTSNGLRIKTWPSDVQMTAYNITFNDVVMDNTYNPIIIDQQYCSSKGCDQSRSSSVQIKDVWFKNIRGTSKSQSAVNIQCSRRFPCYDINFSNINLLYGGPDGKTKKELEEKFCVGVMALIEKLKSQSLPNNFNLEN